jgi:hypothetical protein
LSRQPDQWWREASRLADGLAAFSGEGRPARYRLGDGYLEVRSEDARLGDRLELLFRECAVAQLPEDGLPRVRCTVQAPAGAEFALVAFEDPEPLDQVAFTLQVISDRGYQEAPSLVPGWRMIAMPTPEGVGQVAMSGSRLLVDRATPWQALVGSLAMNRLFRLQRGLLFLHAGSVGIRGRGVLLVGPKGAGKTTLSLALAARGHDLLGDEIAGVRIGSLELVPVRRSLAVRDGPRAEAVGGALDRVAAPYEPFPDGTQRRRAYAGQLFPGASVSPLPLREVIFLRGFAPEPRLEAVRPGREHLGLLTPLGASLWGVPAFSRARDLLKLITGARCSMLHAGQPDATAELLIHSVED